MRLDDTLIDPAKEAKIVTIDNNEAATRSGIARIWGHQIAPMGILEIIAPLKEGGWGI